jgi:hypothetical protein
LNPNEYDWYVFHFDYEDDNLNQPIEIKMLAEPYNGATLTIRNQAQIDKWIRDGEHLHFGCTTMVNEDANFDGFADYSQWAGTLRESGDYFLVVEHARDVTVPANYQFTITGDDISFPAQAMPVAAEEVASEMTSATAEVEPTAAPMAVAELLGTGPDFAMAPNGEWTPLQSGQYHWYKFTYDESDDWVEPVTIRLYTEPLDGAILTVRNGEQANLWRHDGEHHHFGCCTRPEFTTQVETDDEDEEDGMIEETAQLDYATWSADLDSSGDYYLVVEHTKNSAEPAFYRFDIVGQGLDF